MDGKRLHRGGAWGDAGASRREHERPNPRQTPCMASTWYQLRPVFMVTSSGTENAIAFSIFRTHGVGHIVHFRARNFKNQFVVNLQEHRPPQARPNAQRASRFWTIASLHQNRPQLLVNGAFRGSRCRRRHAACSCSKGTQACIDTGLKSSPTKPPVPRSRERSFRL